MRLFLTQDFSSPLAAGTSQVSGFCILQNANDARVGRFLCFSVFNLSKRLHTRLEKLWTTILNPLQEKKK